MLDDRLLHVTKEAAKAYLDEYIQRRDLDDSKHAERPDASEPTTETPDGGV